MMKKLLSGLAAVVLAVVTVFSGTPQAGAMTINVVWQQAGYSQTQAREEIESVQVVVKRNRTDGTYQTRLEKSTAQSGHGMLRVHSTG